MKRRAFLGGLTMFVFAVSTESHTPYRQWKVYRLRHLLIGTSRADAPTYPLGQRVVAVLAKHLPQSSPRVTRARTVSRLGDLIRTQQIRTLLLSRAHARALAAGEKPFAPGAPIPVRVLFLFGPHLLVTDAGFPDHHAYQVTATLTQYATHLPGAAAPDESLVHLPSHPGSLAAVRGDPMPVPKPGWGTPEVRDEESPHSH